MLIKTNIMNKNILKFRILQFCLAFVITNASAQIVSNNAFLQGNYVEVGVAPCGSFGSTVSAPAGYHARPAGALGFVADPAKDGWDIGSPNYVGDYFLPGSPEEGWGITANGINYNNNQTCFENDIPGSIIDYSNTGSDASATWEGAIGGLSITSRTNVPINAAFFVTKVTIVNTTDATINDVFYMRNVDPDQGVFTPEAGGGFTTNNSIIFQNPNSTDTALAAATSLQGDNFLGLGSIDSRARVTHGGFSNRNAMNIWTGIGFNSSGAFTADEAISISFNLGNLEPNQSTTFSYVYILSIDDLDIEEALAATSAISDITCDSAVLNATSTETGTGYWMVVPNDSTAPTAAQIKNGTDYDSVTVVSSGSGPVTANVESLFNITDLTPTTSYDVYFVSEDGTPTFSTIAEANILTLDTATYFLDADGDGFGNPDESIEACYNPDSPMIPNGYVDNADDCNDSDASIGDEETCDPCDNDTENPEVTCPGDITVSKDSEICGAIVNFMASYTDNCPDVSASSIPASGSEFPIGTTEGTVTAIDATGNEQICSFFVTVQNDETIEPIVTTASICEGDTYVWDVNDETYSTSQDITILGVDCEPNQQLILTVNPLPTVTFAALSNLSEDSGIQSGLSGGTPIGGIYSGPGVTDDGNGMTYSFNPSVAGIGIHSISYTVTNDDCTNSASDDVEVTSNDETGCSEINNVWTGESDSDWTNIANWQDNMAPGLSTDSDIAIPAGMPNYPVLTYGQDLYLNECTTLIVDNGAYIMVNPNVVVSNDGTVKNYGTMTFGSNENGSAYIGSGTGTFMGDFTVERYIPAKRAYRQLASPVMTSTPISENWQQDTHITGPYGNTDGFDVTETGNPSMYLFDNEAYNYVLMANTNATNLYPNTMYHILVRGDRNTDLTNNNATPSVTTLRATGELTAENEGSSTVVITVPEQRFIAVGNPFQSQVDMNAVLTTNATNITPTYYWVWDPTLGYRGAYTTIIASTGMAVPFDSDANQYLQAGQAGWIYTAGAGDSSVSFTQASKANSEMETEVFRSSGKTEESVGQLSLSLYESSALANNESAADGLLILFDTEGNNAVDGLDAPKITNLDENFATNNDGTLLSIENRAAPQDAEEIQLEVNTYRNTNYTIVAEGVAMQGETAYLFDAYTTVSTEIPQNGTVNYAYSVDSGTPESIAGDRFKIIYEATALSVDTLDMEAILLYPNPTSIGKFYLNIPLEMDDLEVTIYNALGAKLYSKTGLNGGSKATIDTSFILNQGMYFVELRSHGKTIMKKLNIN
mgnify:CR=1 FL=1